MTRSAKVPGVDRSRAGVGIRCRAELRPGTAVYVQDQENRLAGYGVVRHCTPQGEGFLIGLQFTDETRQTFSIPTTSEADYYEFLQISPRAEPETLQRVYRFLAARFHPDNPQTGDPERFLELNRAYEVLSDPERRAQYDASRETDRQANPAFESVDFMDGVEGELNRRLAVLSILYRRCRADVENPRVTLADMESAMAFPREYLDFTTWYLRSKKYITREDNSDFALTVLGVDYIEANYDKLPVLRKLLSAGGGERTVPRGDDPKEDADLGGEIFIVGPIPVDGVEAGG